MSIALRAPLARVARLTLEVAPAATLRPAPPGTAQSAWLGPDGDCWIGRGAARVWTAGERPGAAEAVIDDCRATLAGLADRAPDLRAFGAVAFDPARAVDPLGADVPVARFTLPRWLLRLPAAAVARGGAAEAWLVGEEPFAGELEALRRWAGEPAPGWDAPAATVVADEGGDEDYEEMVARALGAVAAGRLAKVVLARPRYVEAAAHLSPWAAFWALAAAQPGTSRFLLIGVDGEAFLGASPERLLALDGDRLAADVLAGTSARGLGPADDAARAAALRASAKDAHEHALVREAVLAALAPFTRTLSAQAEPAALALPNVWHLHTPVHGRLVPGARLGALVTALHPTPAVAGAPAADARALIRALERTGRGWYAGPVGWIAADAAHLAVGIRSAHVRGNRAAALAGAGIVRGSDPAGERGETERKLAPMLAALTGGRAAR